jgi:hypothetical protein
MSLLRFLIDSTHITMLIGVQVRLLLLETQTMANKYFATFTLIHFVKVIKCLQADAAVCGRFEEDVGEWFFPDFWDGWVVILGDGAVFSVENHVWNHDVTFEKPEGKIELDEVVEAGFVRENILLYFFNDIIISN